MITCQYIEHNKLFFDGQRCIFFLWKPRFNKHTIFVLLLWLFLMHSHVNSCTSVPVWTKTCFDVVAQKPYQQASIQPSSSHIWTPTPKPRRHIGNEQGVILFWTYHDSNRSSLIFLFRSVGPVERLAYYCFAISPIWLGSCIGLHCLLESIIYIYRYLTCKFTSIPATFKYTIWSTCTQT